MTREIACGDRVAREQAGAMRWHTNERTMPEEFRA
jgi:hypothetical protein